MSDSRPLLDPPRTRVGFTAVELLIVIGVMLLLTGMAAPAVLKPLRRGAVNAAANDIAQCWREARSMAMAKTLPTGASPSHYGIVIKQEGGRGYVAVIFDTAATAPRLLRRDPAGADSDATNPPVERRRFSRAVALARADTVAGPPDTSDGEIVLYAQYGTGAPIAPAAVANGKTAANAAPVGVGVWDGPGLATSTYPLLRVQTLDFVAHERGAAARVTIFHTGIVASEAL